MGNHYHPKSNNQNPRQLNHQKMNQVFQGLPVDLYSEWIDGRLEGAECLERLDVVESSKLVEYSDKGVECSVRAECSEEEAY